MKLVTYNIQYTRGQDGRYDLDRVAEALVGADIMALQEVERNWRRTGMADQPAAFAARFPAYHWVYGPPIDLDASETDAQGQVIRRRKQFGNMVLSRWPILSTRLCPLPKFAPLGEYNTRAGVLETVIAAPSGPLRFYCLHLAHLIAEERLAQIAVLWDILRRAPDEGGPWSGIDPRCADLWECEAEEPPMPREAIVMGDFNLLPGSPEYDALVGPRDRAVGRIPVRHRLVDAWVAAGHAEEDGVTYPRNPENRTPFDMKLDYGFVTAGLADRVTSAWIDDEAAGSDHQPVWIEIDL